MSLFPFSSLFLITLTLGSIIAISGNHWILVWMGLELNLLSFVPLLTIPFSNQESEAAINYFLAQALGSGLILLGALSLTLNDQMLFHSHFWGFIITLGLLTNLGIPPCHFWFPNVMALISWPICIILSTWQNLIPILLIFYITAHSFNNLIALTVIAGALIGGVGGINQTQLRPLLAFSSIGHISWIIAGAISSYSSGLLYFITYIIISVPIILSLWISSSSITLTLNPVLYTNNMFTTSLILLILSLGGIPPLTGFFPNWLILEGLSSWSPTLCLFILLGSALNLYYYLNLLFICYINSSNHILLTAPNFTTNKVTPIIITATLTLGLGPILFTLIYALTLLH